MPQLNQQGRNIKACVQTGNAARKRMHPRRPAARQYYGPPSLHTMNMLIRTAEKLSYFHPGVCLLLQTQNGMSNEVLSSQVFRVLLVRPPFKLFQINMYPTSSKTPQNKLFH